MEIRQPQARDLAAVKRLWSCCFEKEEEPFFQWFFANRYRAENALGVFEKGELLSALHIAPYTLQLRGASMQAGYLMGVGTFPEFRQQGCMTALLTATLTEMRRQGQWISALLPRRPSIYTRHGWEICYHTLKYSIPAYALPTGGEVPPGWRQVQSTDDVFLLDSIYRQYMQPYHGYVIRSEGNWQDLIIENQGEGGQLFLLEINGTAVGYVMFAAHRDKLFIKEMAYASGAARDLIFAFIGCQAGKTARVDWQLPLDDPSYLNFTDERSGITLYPFTSGRIVDVAQALTQYKPVAASSGTVTVGITDPLAPWNQGVFRLTEQSGLLSVTPGETPDVEMNIGCFSQLFFGSADVDALASIGRIVIHNADRLSLLRQLFPHEKNVIYENF